MELHGRKRNRGSEKRKSHSIDFKAKVLEHLLNAKQENPSMSHEALCALYDISQGMLSRWLGGKRRYYPDNHPDSYFARTGCLLTLDGSEDEKINIEGAPEYKPPTLLQFDDDQSDDEVAPAPEAHLNIVEPEPESDVTDDSDVEIVDECM